MPEPKPGKQPSVRVAACTIVIDEREKTDRVFYDRLFAFCDARLGDVDAEIILLPERCVFRDEEAQPLDGPMARRFAGMAVELGTWLLAPLAELEDGKVYNTQAVFSPEGELVFRYRKVHLAPGEEKEAAPGDAFGVFEMPWFRAGIVICYDHKLPESERCLAAQGAQVVFFPSFGDVRDARRDAARCLDNNTYLVCAGVIDLACNLPREVFQRGAVVGPDGEDLVRAETEESVVVAELPLDPNTGRLALTLPEGHNTAHRKPERYGPLVT